MTTKRIITGTELGEMLIDAGIVPDNCLRIIIDINHHQAVTIYYQGVGDERLLEVDWGTALGVKTDDNDTAKTT